MSRIPSLFCLALSLAFLSSQPAHAATASPDLDAKSTPSASPEPGDSDAATRATALLEKIEAADASATRLHAAEELAALGHEAIPALKAFLERPRDTSDEQRRVVLRAISADVPDEDGRFVRRRRGQPVDVKGGDDYDWLAELAALPSMPAGSGEVMADIAAIRALAATEHPDGSDHILAFAFTDTGMTYRDECGRYLRKMAPYSLPTLIRASGDNNDAPAQRRYAGYQLERIDRKVPAKAIHHASIDESLEVAVLDAYGASKPREAVGPLLATTNDAAPRVRAAARAAWMKYVTGPEPPPAPTRKLKLTGGRKSEEEEPLWLTYRELADIELRRTYAEVFGDKAPRRAALKDLSEELFAHYDSRREAALEARYQQAVGAAERGDLAAATAAYDRILAEAPEHPQRASMAETYLAHGLALEREQAWREAAAAYSKAHALLPNDSAEAKAALAGHYYTLGKALAADGKASSTWLRRAAELDPERSANAATSGNDSGGDDPDASSAPAVRWMLYAGAAGCVGAIFLFILGVVVRQRDRHHPA